jgi:hypothetical protein
MFGSDRLVIYDDEFTLGCCAVSDGLRSRYDVWNWVPLQY